VLRIAMPMVASTLSWTLMSFIDSSILFRVSGMAMSAAFSSSVIWFAALSLLWGICSYASTFVSQYWGDRQPERIGPVVWQGVWLAAFFTPVILLARPFAGYLFRMHEPELAGLETTFFQILCFGAPGMLAAQSLEAFFSGRGKTWVVMCVDAGAVLVNLILAIVLVLGWGGIEPWGFVGAAWATVAAQWSRAALFATLVLWPTNRRRYNTMQASLDGELIRRLLRFGGPSGVQMLVDVGGYSIFVLLVGKLGVAANEATSVAFRISQVAFMPVWGLGMATAVLVGQKLGEDRPDFAERAARTTLTMALAYMGGISLLFVLAPRLFLQGFFTHSAGMAADPAGVEQLAIELLRFVAAYNMFDAAVIIFVSVLRGAGDTRFVMRLSTFMASLLTAGTVLGVYQLGMNVYEAWTYITVWVWALGVIYYLRYRRGLWRQMRVIEQVHHGHGYLTAEGNPLEGDVEEDAVGLSAS
jgi:MATE family multidrug resistance protein